MQCHQVAERLTDLMEGELSEADEAAALEHLATCASCEQILSDTREVLDLASTHGHIELAPSDRDRMWATLSTEVEKSAGA